MKVGELFVKLGIKADNDKLEKFKNETSKLPSKLGILKTALAGLSFYGFKKLVDNTVDATVALQNFNNQTGIAIESLQKWQRVGMLSDISLTSEQIAGGIQALQSNLAQIRLGGGNLAPFQMLGIDPSGKNAIQILEELRGALRGLDRPTAVNLIQQMGLNPNFINVLQTTREEFDRLGSANFLSEKQRQGILKIGTAITKITLDVKILAKQLVSALEPVISNVLGLVDNGVWLLKEMTNALNENKNAWTGLGLAVGAVAVAMAPISATIAGVILLLEDLVVYLRGGKSIFGEVFGLFDKLGDKFERIVDKFFELKNSLGEGTFGKIGKKLLDNTVFGELFEGMNLFKLLKAGMSANTNINNTYNINSTEPSQKLANDITNTQKRQLNQTLADFNNMELA